MPSDSFTFETATKDQAKARIALAGPAGSGKTWTALVLATRFGGLVAVIDTERGSASKYADQFAFDRLNLTRYDPRDLPRALAAAAQHGYAVVVIDSLSRFWSGEGGMLEQVDGAAKRGYGGNSFGGWKEARPMENAMVEAMLGYPGHVIVTMRTKTAYEVTTDANGRKVPVKIGLKPEQREGIEYEFDIVGDLDIENTLTVSKSRCPALSGAVIRRPDAAVADVILGWLGEGRPNLDASGYRDLALEETDPVVLRELWGEVRHRGLSGAAIVDEHGETVTLGEFIARKGKEALPVRTGDELPRNADGSISRSRTTEAEKDAAGIMTDAQRKEHTALGGGNGKVPRADRARVQRGAQVLAELAPVNLPGTITPAERGRVMALFSRWFTEDEREQRIQAAEQVLGRELSGPHEGRSFNNLAIAEAGKLKATLGEVKTRDDLIALLAGEAANG
jgi:AAA domain